MKISNLSANVKAVRIRSACMYENPNLRKFRRFVSCWRSLSSLNSHRTLIVLFPSIAIPKMLPSRALTACMVPLIFEIRDCSTAPTSGPMRTLPIGHVLGAFSLACRPFWILCSWSTTSDIDCYARLHLRPAKIRLTPCRPSRYILNQGKKHHVVYTLLSYDAWRPQHKYPQTLSTIIRPTTVLRYQGLGSGSTIHDDQVQTSKQKYNIVLILSKQTQLYRSL